MLWWIISTAVALIPVAALGLRIYYLRMSSAAADDERDAGAAESQVSAQNEENNRINAAADAGAAAEQLPIDTAASDPDNRAVKQASRLQ